MRTIRDPCTHQGLSIIQPLVIDRSISSHHFYRHVDAAQNWFVHFAISSEPTYILPYIYNRQ
jgi:hypothetical protein